MESIWVSAPGTTSYTVGVEWSNFISGLGGACVDDESRLEVLSYRKISSRPTDYVVEYTSKSSDGKVYYRLLNYGNLEQKIGLYDLNVTCINTFNNFFKGKNISSDILFQARGVDKTTRDQAKKIIQSFRYQ